MAILNEARIFRLHKNLYDNREAAVDFDDFANGLEYEAKKLLQSAKRTGRALRLDEKIEEDLAELVYKRLEINPDAYVSKTESGHPEQSESRGSKVKPVKRTPRTSLPGEREENPSGEIYWLKIMWFTGPSMENARKHTLTLGCWYAPEEAEAIANEILDTAHTNDQAHLKSLIKRYINKITYKDSEDESPISEDGKSYTDLMYNSSVHFQVCSFSMNSPD